MTLAPFHPDCGPSEPSSRSPRRPGWRPITGRLGAARLLSGPVRSGARILRCRRAGGCAARQVREIRRGDDERIRAAPDGGRPPRWTMPTWMTASRMPALRGGARPTLDSTTAAPSERSLRSRPNGCEARADRALRERVVPARGWAVLLLFAASDASIPVRRGPGSGNLSTIRVDRSGRSLPLTRSRGRVGSPGLGSHRVQDPRERLPRRAHELRRPSRGAGPIRRLLGTTRLLT